MDLFQISTVKLKWELTRIFQPIPVGIQFFPFNVRTYFRKLVNYSFRLICRNEYVNITEGFGCLSNN